MRNTIKLCLAFLCFFTIVGVEAFAFDHNKTINLAGKQRMLSQKMSKEAIFIAANIDVEQNLAQLTASRNLFDKTLKGLVDGDAELGLKPTKKPKILKQLKKVGKIWADFDAVISQVISTGSIADEQVKFIADNNLKLLKEMNKAVKFYESDAVGQGTNIALAKAINLAGRQRMLTQKMSKEFGFIALGYNVDENKAALEKTMTLFDTTLNGLIDGNTEVGLSPAPEGDVKNQLILVKDLWGGFSNYLLADPTVTTGKTVSDQNIPLLKEMNKAVILFEKL